MADHKHGSMNVDVQEKTFTGFIRLATYTALVVIGILVFMALFTS